MRNWKYSGVVFDVLSALSRKAKVTIISAIASVVFSMGGFLLIIILIMVMAGGKNEIVQQQASSIPANVYSDSVIAYKTQVIEECINNDIQEYVEVVLSIMQILTSGSGTDPMMATYKVTNKKYNPENGLEIEDPIYSIKVGIEEIAWLIKKIGIKSPDDTEKLKILLSAYISDREVLDIMKETYDRSVLEKYIQDNKLDERGAYAGFPEEVIGLINSVSIDSSGNVSSGGGFIWPLPEKYKAISSPFGDRNCPFHGLEHHDGVDIPAPLGTVVYAAKGGTVTTSTYHYSFGNYVVINHGDGTASQYNHCSKLLVNVGQKVTQGQSIAKVGSTGSSTGAHLDFRIFINGKAVDPIPQIGKGNAGNGNGGLQYTDEELDLVSRLLCREAGATWASDEHQQLVVSVVVNRVKSPLFPNTIKGVINQKGQYAPAISGSINSAKPDERTKRNAKYVLDNGAICPANVLYQANFKQGSGVYKQIYDKILKTTTYFCYQ